MITTSAVGGTERKTDEEDKDRPFRGADAVVGETLISFLPVIVTQPDLYVHEQLLRPIY